MSLVGDVILTCREQMPDVPQVVFPPVVDSAVQGAPVTPPGGLVAGNSYVVQCTAVNAWGETTPSTEVGPITLTGSNNSIDITVTAAPGSVYVRFYLGVGGTGSEYVYYQVAVPPTSGGTFTFNWNGPGQAAQQPPTYNTAFNPDADGASIGAFTIFRWLNDALQEMSRIAGGILDMTGVQANTLQADYVIPQAPCPWIRFTDAWFDGYFCQDFKRRNQWRRQFISAISFYWSVEQVNRQMVLNFYPVPNRNGVFADLAAPISATDTLIPLVNIPAGMMFPGMCQIDSEIIIYSTSDSNNNLTGCIRGMGGTTAVAHNTGAAPSVTEFNLVLAGFRQPVTYVPGQSATELLIPTGWEMPIINFVLSRYRNYEQNRQEAADLYKAFVEEAKRIAFDSRQFPASATIGGPASFLTLYPGGPFGVIIP